MFQQLDIAIAFVVVMLLLSLLVTAIVQAISALFDLRGKNLARALADLLTQIDTGLKATPPKDTTLTPFKLWQNNIWNFCVHPFTKITLATRLADAITKHPTLAHTFTRAKSIRKDELLDVLKDLSSDTSLATVDRVAKARLKQILAAQLPGGTATADTAQLLAAELGNKFPNLKDQFAQIMAQTMGSISGLEVGIEKWFDTVMDRASDVFTRWTRTITIVISVLLVGILQIDAGLILKQISTNPDVRAGLVKLSDTALAQADEALKAGSRGSDALKAVAENHAGDTTLSGLNNAPALGTCVEGKRWLQDYGNSKQIDTSQLQKEFEDNCQQLATAQLGTAGAQIKQFHDELVATNLKIVPDGADGKPVTSSVESWKTAYRSSGSHLLGILAMVVLLSLGAPFWYNALKQLSNLKPSVTQKIEKESASS